jgi:hypothetical protein
MDDQIPMLTATVSGQWHEVMIGYAEMARQAAEFRTLAERYRAERDAALTELDRVRAKTDEPVKLKAKEA